MCKEQWYECFQAAVEDIMEELDIEGEEAEKVLRERLDKDTFYLDGYLDGYRDA